MKQKRNWILFLLLCAIAAHFIVPQRAVEEDFQVHLVRAGVQLENVTERADTEALSVLLQGQTRGPFRRQFAPAQLTESTVEITGMDSRGHRHFMLDTQTQVVYESAEQGGWPIRNGEALLDEVREILNEE